MPSNRPSGFTLVELMIAIAVLAILLAIALPSFQQSLRSNRVATATNEMVASLALARSEALRNKRGGGVCASSNGTACGANWNDGWLVWADVNGNGALDAAEAVLRYSQLSPRLQGAGPGGGVVAFDARGRRQAAANQAVTLRPDECGGQPMQRTLTINASGQVTTVRGDCS